MFWSHRRTASRGFTLIEILIVVVLIGILAGIVMMVFGDHITATREVAVKGDLHVLRTQIISYQVQHANALPPSDRLAETLLVKTDLTGNPLDPGIEPHLGPYLAFIPPNPINHLNTIKVIPAGADLVPDDTTGWLYQADSSTFKIVPNTSQVDSQGNPIAEY